MNALEQRLEIDLEPVVVEDIDCLSVEVGHRKGEQGHSQSVFS
jgi:hypothetical protein